MFRIRIEITLHSSDIMVPDLFNKYTILAFLLTSLNIPWPYPTDHFIYTVMISRSGDCHPHPGPTYRFPCGVCKKPCKSNQNCIARDSCDQWFHINCMKMPPSVFHDTKNTSWICCTCGLPNFSSTLFETTHIDSFATSIATDNSYSILSSSRDQPDSPASSSHANSFSSLDSSIGTSCDISDKR